MTEVGPVTHECPARPGVLHVMEPQFIAEVIDPGTGEPVGPGSRGELVLTNLGRTGSPLLRYRTGDLVEPEPPARCVCGRWELALAGGILGRTDDMVVVRGVNLYPAAFEAILRGFPAVVEYRVEITTGPGLPEARVLVELNEPGGATAATAERIELALRSALTLRVPVVSVPAGSLPRFELKGQRWLRKEGIRVEC
jgi:phenylacetate-CoA ligase